MNYKQLQRLRLHNKTKWLHTWDYLHNKTDKGHNVETWQTNNLNATDALITYPKDKTKQDSLNYDPRPTFWNRFKDQANVCNCNTVDKNTTIHFRDEINCYRHNIWLYEKLNIWRLIQLPTYWLMYVYSKEKPLTVLI